MKEAKFTVKPQYVVSAINERNSKRSKSSRLNYMREIMDGNIDEDYLDYKYQKTVDNNYYM